MAAIGAVENYYILSNSATTSYKTNLGTSFTYNPLATYEEVDAASRAVIGLTTDTYQDTVLVTSISVNEKLAEEG